MGLLSSIFKPKIKLELKVYHDKIKAEIKNRRF